MAVEHFDEGVYVSNLWFADDGYRYPDAHFYAPPLLPWLIEWAIAFFGPSRWACMSVSVAAAAATIGLVWWVGRSWFGPAAGISAALLAAFSDVHILYSRTALTDVPLCFWLLLSVYLIWLSVCRSSVLLSVLAGLATAAGWWTKYTGWLPLAIGAAGLIPSVLLDGVNSPTESRAQRWRPLMLWIGTVTTAWVAWSPVLVGLQDHGGYAAVAANHQQYVVGLNGWWQSLAQQRSAHSFLSGWLTCGSILMAFCATHLMSAVSHRFTWNIARRSIGSSCRSEILDTSKVQTGRSSWLAVLVPVLVLTAIACVIGFSSLLALLAVVAVVLDLWPLRWRANSFAAPTTNGRLAVWLLAAWIAGLSVAIPFYQPYPRLTLPWLIAVWLGAGAALSRMGALCETVRLHCAVSAGRRRAGQAIAIGAAAISLTVVCWKAPCLNRCGVPAWESRTCFERMAPQIIRDARQDVSRPDAEHSAVGNVEFIFYVYAEPGLFYHLSAANVVAQPVTDLNFVDSEAPPSPVPVFLLAGPHALRSTQFQQQLATHLRRLRLVKEYQFTPSSLVLLNDFDPSHMTGDVTQTVRLYRAVF